MFRLSSTEIILAYIILLTTVMILILNAVFVSKIRYPTQGLEDSKTYMTILMSIDIILTIILFISFVYITAKIARLIA